MISHCALTVEEQRDEHPLWRASAALATWGLSDSPEHLPSLFHPLRHIPGPKLAAITYLLSVLLQLRSWWDVHF